MKNEYAALTATGAHAPVLQSVSAHGRLEGLLLSMTLKQSFRNDSAENMEVVYTFPLAWGAVLLGLEATLGNKRMTGQVIGRSEARQQYEEAVEKGDAPIMVEKTASGVFSASLGSLKPGEAAVIELTYAQLLSFDQGRIRLVVPTTIAPRYGDAVLQGGLSPDQAATPDLLAEHGFKLSVALCGSVAQARIGSPTHSIAQQRDGEVANITLQGSHWLDRDFVLLLDDLQGQSFAITGPDERSGVGHAAMIASYCPALQQAPSAPLRLKVLVDCSGSMTGDSIAQARDGLRPLALQLTPEDQISFSRFGNQTQRVLSPVRASRQNIKAFLTAIDHTEANMGGTELAAALKDTFDLDMSPARQAEEADVLLITDGEVWDAQRIVEQAQRSGHRIYALGVGSAPAESLLREMAETTGGTCEFATPHEDMEHAIQRLLAKIRLAMPVQAKIGTPIEPLWCSPLPRRLAAGETAHIFMRFPESITRAPSLQLDQLSLTEASLSVQDSDLIARLVAAREVSLSSDRNKARELAEAYQLVTEETSLLLGIERAEADKTDGMPALHKVRPMMAAGWGGSGRIGLDSGLCFSLHPIVASSLGNTVIPSVWRTSGRRSPAPAHDSSEFPDLAFGDIDFDVPAFLRNPSDSRTQWCEPEAARPEEIVAAFNAAASRNQPLRPTLRAVTALNLSTSLLQSIENAALKLGGPVKAWACYLLWLHGKGIPELKLSSQGLALATDHAKGIAPDAWAICVQIFEHQESEGQSTCQRP